MRKCRKRNVTRQISCALGNAGYYYQHANSCLRNRFPCTILLSHARAVHSSPIGPLSPSAAAHSSDGVLDVRALLACHWATPHCGRLRPPPVNGCNLACCSHRLRIWCLFSDSRVDACTTAPFLSSNTLSGSSSSHLVAAKTSLPGTTRSVDIRSGRCFAVDSGISSKRPHQRGL